MVLVEQQRSLPVLGESQHSVLVGAVVGPEGSSRQWQPAALA